MTRAETQLILDEGITIDGKPLREHLEVVNLAEAIDYVEELVTKNQAQDERTIKDIHRVVYEKLAQDRRGIGSYRRVPVYIRGSEHRPPSPYLLEQEMQQLMVWSQEEKVKLHPVEYAALLHQKFVYIHPFIDGNGRTARLLLNFALTQHGYPPIYIKADAQSRRAYNESLETAHVKGDTSSIVALIAERVESKLMEMLEILKMAEAMSHKTYTDI